MYERGKATHQKNARDHATIQIVICKTRAYIDRISPREMGVDAEEKMWYHLACLNIMLL